jgi:aryl-alcohol dehydrogenase-like predicted oxidoreductase
MRILGTTGLDVSPVGLGMAALGRPGYINLGHAKDLNGEYSLSAMEQQAHEVLDAAWASGVRYFDVARSYGLAEAFLGSWLSSRGIDPNSVTVGSKWGYKYTAGWKVDAEKHEVKEHSLPVLLSQWQESWSNLGDQLDLYQIHSATIEDHVLENTEVLEELLQLSRRGIKIGLTLSGERQAETLHKALTVKFDGVSLFCCVQATWNLLEKSAGPALEEAHSLGWGVIVKEALANGRLTARNDNPAFAETRKILEREAERLDTTIDALAIAAVLAQPWADVVLSGATTVEQLQSNLAALNVSWVADAATRFSTLTEPPQFYWNERSKLAWN